MPRITFCILLLLFSCTPHKNHEGTAMSNLIDIDSNLIHFDTVSVLREHYRIFGTKNSGVYVLNTRGDTVIHDKDLYFDFELNDVNGDNLDDIVVHRISSISGLTYLLLFDATHRSFHRVKNFEKFPMPTPIPGTHYFYSYHRSGCADAYWDSDLFYLQDYEAIQLGNISGNACEGDLGIVVSKVTNGEKLIIDTFDLDTLETYRDYKWGFIADYWQRHSHKFID